MGHIAGFWSLTPSFFVPYQLESIDIQSKNRKVTPLMMAVIEEDLTVIQEIFYCGPDAGLTDSDGSNVMHYAAVANQTHVITLMLNQNVEIRRLLLQKNKHGIYPIFLACIVQVKGRQNCGLWGQLGTHETSLISSCCLLETFKCCPNT